MRATTLFFFSSLRSALRRVDAVAVRWVVVHALGAGRLDAFAALPPCNRSELREKKKEKKGEWGRRRKGECRFDFVSFFFFSLSSLSATPAFRLTGVLVHADARVTIPERAVAFPVLKRSEKGQGEGGRGVRCERKRRRRTNEKVCRKKTKNFRPRPQPRPLPVSPRLTSNSLTRTRPRRNRCQRSS